MTITIMIEVKRHLPPFPLTFLQGEIFCDKIRAPTAHGAEVPPPQEYQNEAHLPLEGPQPFQTPLCIEEPYCPILL